MPEGVTITVTGMNEELARIAKMKQIISEPDLDAGVKRVATIWDRNFISEGQDVGGWRQLSPMTQRTRRQRGYPGKHPIHQTAVE